MHGYTKKKCKVSKIKLLNINYVLLSSLYIIMIHEKINH